jgi:hypothetical protein
MNDNTRRRRFNPSAVFVIYGAVVLALAALAMLS